MPVGGVGTLRNQLTTSRYRLATLRQSGGSHELHRESPPECTGRGPKCDLQSHSSRVVVAMVTVSESRFRLHLLRRLAACRAVIHAIAGSV